MNRSTFAFAATLPLFAPTMALRAQAPIDAQRLDSVSRYVESEMQRLHIPGMSVAILHGDSIVMARGFGYANVELRVPASDSTIYQSGSVGKQFTSAAIMLLAERGKLSLDDPITHWLPEGKTAWKGITIRHLLSHTSGIANYTDGAVDLRKEYTENDLIRLALKSRLDFQPGTHWNYSNTGFVLLGAIVRRVTGQFYGNFLHDNVFVPLGMRTARIISEADIVPNRASGYHLAGDTLRNQEWVSPSLNTTADGALYLTVRDLAAWAVGLNHGRVPSAASLATSWTPNKLSTGGTYPYGFGWGLSPQRGVKKISHTGSWQGFKTAIARYPTLDLTVIVMSNLAETPIGPIDAAIAGIVEPSLAMPHRLAGTTFTVQPPVPIGTLLSRVASGDAAAPITPALRGFMNASERKALSRQLAASPAWRTLGCDRMADATADGVGAGSAYSCYAVSDKPGVDRAFTVLYTPDWKASWIEMYNW
ncbi:MAG: serine hydrolase domain-containing protein [Gemmatimonadaceae bacterium]